MSALTEQLKQEDNELRFADFTVEDAWDLGSRMRAAAAEQDLPIAIGIMLGPQRVFHSALPGASADNDGWLRARHGGAALRAGVPGRRGELP